MIGLPRAVIVFRQQIKYAAGDALVGIEIFSKLLESKAVHQTSAQPTTDLEIWRKALSACQGIVDVNFSSKGMSKGSNKEKVSRKRSSGYPINV